MAVNDLEKQAIEDRRKFVEAWNDLMIQIWQEQIIKLGVIDTRALLSSTMKFPVKADGRYMELHLAQSFLEYGLWQDLGTGREVKKGNPGDIGRAKVRERRRWYSVKYFRSVNRLAKVLGQMLGEDFKAMMASALSANYMRHNSAHYRKMGY